MPRPRDPDGSTFAWIERFDRTTRVVHWSLAALVLVLVATGAILYVDSWAAAVGRRHLVRDLHLLAGLAVPVTVIGPALLPVGRRYRRELGRLDRWEAGALRTIGRRPGSGKFSAGQRLFAALAGGALAVLATTGAVLHWFRFFPLEWRAGATAVHDVAASGLALGIAGHIVLAFAHPAAFRGMLTGWVRATWARRAHPRWYEALDDVYRTRTDRSSNPSRIPASEGEIREVTRQGAGPSELSSGSAPAACPGPARR